MRHISANCRLQVVIFPRLSTTRMPSAVDSRVARSSDEDLRWSTSAGPRLRPFFILPAPLMVLAGIVIRIRPPGKCFHAGSRRMPDSGVSEVSPAGDALVSLQSFWKLPTLKKAVESKRRAPRCQHEAAQHRT